MMARMQTGTTRTLVWLLLLATGSSLSHARSPTPDETAVRVEAAMEQVKQSFFSHSGNIKVMPAGWDRALAYWQPDRISRHRPAAPQRGEPASPLIRQLVSDAIRRQNADSIRVMHRLDRLLDGRLFGHHEALLATAIAQRQELDIAFRPRAAVLTNQQLTEIDQTRRLKSVLAEQGPIQAIRLVPSFDQLCRKRLRGSDD